MASYFHLKLSMKQRSLLVKKVIDFYMALKTRGDNNVKHLGRWGVHADKVHALWEVDMQVYDHSYDYKSGDIPLSPKQIVVDKNKHIAH